MRARRLLPHDDDDEADAPALDVDGLTPPAADGDSPALEGDAPAEPPPPKCDCLILDEASTTCGAA